MSKKEECMYIVNNMSKNELVDYIYKLELKNELIKELVEFALTHAVDDYVYILEDLEKILKDKKTTINKNDYWR